MAKFFNSHFGGSGRIATAVLTGCLVFMMEAVGADAWHGSEWSGEIILPPGSYDGAGKTVKMKDEPKVTVGPRSEMAMVDFDGKANWKVTESLFREVSIFGDLGLYFKATDSAFEMCDFYKDGGWFVQYWSTKWRFENCVFSRQFFGRKALGVTDFSIRASRCTFYGLEMPVISYKEDPARLAQCNDLKFEKCRFVSCSIPESVLAATIGCVFENCTFPNKRENWTKAEKPIVVSATIVTRNKPPESYENGPLKVEFNTLAPPSAGAAIPVRNDGGRLTYAAVRSDNAQKLGDLNGNQSSNLESRPEEATAKERIELAEASTESNGEKKSFFGIPVLQPNGASATQPDSVAAPSNGKLSVQTPLFVARTGGGLGAMPVRLSASVSSIGQTSPSVVTFTQFSGAEGQKAIATLKRVLAQQKREWGKGQRIDLAFSERIVPADLESALFAAVVLVDAAFNGTTVDSRVSVVGTLESDGSLNTPPWLTTRMMASLRGGVRRMVAPEKGAAQVADLMLGEGLAPFANMQIFGANSFEEVPPMISSPPERTITDAIREFGTAQQLLTEAGDASEKALHEPQVMEAFRDTLVNAASHLSARILLGHSSGRFNELSLAGSVEIVENRGPTLVRAVRSSNPSMVGGLTAADVQEQVAALANVKDMLDDRAVPWYEGILRYADAVRLWHANPRKTPAQTAELLTSLSGAARVVNSEWPRLVKAIQGNGR